MQLGVRQSDGRPLREHLLSAQRGDGYTHPLLQDDPLPPGGHELFNLVIELGESRPQGMGPAGAIPPSEILAWQQLHGVRLSPWAVTTIRDIDRAMRSAAAKAAEDARKAVEARNDRLSGGDAMRRGH